MIQKIKNSVNWRGVFSIFCLTIFFLTIATSIADSKDTEITPLPPPLQSDFETGMDLPEPEESLEYTSDGWCLYHTPDRCVKWFDNRSEARKYVMTESWK